MYDQFVTMMKNYPIFAGAVSLWGLTVLTYSLRLIPRFFSFIMNQCTTSIEFNNCSGGHAEENIIAFYKWFSANKWAKYSRALSLEPHHHGNHTIGAGYGKHWFTLDGQIFWFYKSKLTSDGAEKEKESIRVYTLGRNHDKLKNAVKHFSYKPAPSQNNIYAPMGGDVYWTRISTRNDKALSNVIINADIKSDILKKMDFFQYNREWYNDRGLAYKQTFLLHGKPGTGKTSIIRALATHYGKHVFTLSLTNNNIESLISRMPPNSILVIEDFDANNYVESRISIPENTTDDCQTQLIGPPDLSKILNIFDGIVPLDSIQIFLTTNHIENIDPAMLRKGRIDFTYEIKYMQNAEIKEYIALMYPEVKDIPEFTGEIAGCDIQSFFMDNHADYDKFLVELNQKLKTTANLQIAA